MSTDVLSTPKRGGRGVTQSISAETSTRWAVRIFLRQMVPMCAAFNCRSVRVWDCVKNFGNLLFGGVIGMLIVDPATGAMWKLEDVYSVNLPATRKMTLSNGSSVNAIDINDVPLHLRGSLVKVD